MQNNCFELLPHVLMGDFTRFVFDAYRKSMSSTEDAKEWHQVVYGSLELMEQAIGSADPMLQELIAVSFVENLTPSYEEDIEVYYALRPLLGPKLRAQLMLQDPTEDWFRHHGPKKEQHYFVMRRGDRDSAWPQGKEFEIQILDHRGRSKREGYIGWDETELVVGDFIVPRSVLEAARRQPRGQGEYVNRAGESIYPLGER